MKKVILSVIIPCYNDGEYLLEAVESVREYKKENYEIIIINDGSTDRKTVEIINDFRKEGCVIINQENKGPSSARNAGIKKAKGRYLLLLDADNKIEPGYIEKGIAVLDKNPEIGVVYSDVKFFGEKNWTRKIPDFDFSLLLTENYIDTCTIIRKNVWEDVGGFDKNLDKYTWEDWIFWIDIYNKGWKFYHIPKILFYYRVKKKSRNKIVDSEKIRNELFDYIGKKYGENIYEEYRKLYNDKRIIDSMLKDRDDQLKDRDNKLKDRNNQLRDKDNQLKDRNNQLRDKDNQLKEKKAIIFNISNKISDIERSLTWRTVQKFDRLIRTFFPYLIKNKINKKRMQKKEKIENFVYKPKISIIMPVYNISAEWLNLAVQSVFNQLYKNWELCIVDDGSDCEETLGFLKSLKNDKIKIKFLKENTGIANASNQALSLATGEYIGLLDHDDELSQDALYEVVKTINKHNPDLIYSDEDKIDMERRCIEPHFKPDYSQDMFFSCNYLCHLVVFRKKILDKVDGFRSGFSGAQDYDLLLRFTEKTQKIYHVPKVLYHWRKIPGSVADNFNFKNYAWESGKRALKDALARKGINGRVILGKRPGLYRIKRRITGNPKVSIIIPFKDKGELLRKCVNSIIKKSTYSNFEIILISNNSQEEKTFEIIKNLREKDSRIKFYEYNFLFNYSQINNYGISISEGEHVLLLNNDTEIISSGWIEAMLEHSQREEIGAVGAKLYYKDNKIQHAGVIIGIQGIAGHSHKGVLREDSGHFSRVFMIQNISAVTGACLMVKKKLYKEIGGMDEKNLKIAFNDIDFCLRLIEKGYLNVFTPYAELYHYESISRGLDIEFKKRKRFFSEVNYIKKRHKDILERGDPYYNPNLSLEHEDFRARED